MSRTQSKDHRIGAYEIAKLLIKKKQRGVQNTVKKLIADNKEITDQTHILECIKEIYETPFKKRKQKTVVEIKSFLKYLNIPKFSEDKSKLCEKDLTEKDTIF